MRSLLPILATALAGLLATHPVEAQTPRFDRDVLPVLSDRCFPCHGPDSGARKADLRLDLRETAFAPREHGAAVVPKDRGASALWQRITSDDPGTIMPPPDSGLSVTTEEAEILGRWIDAGAPWSSHWAFAPPDDPIPPGVVDTSWPRNGIDTFVLARLEAEGLRPNRPAEPGALLRRVHLDLTGLPPTPDELDAFLADPSERAYEQVVDRLLASPRHGERMAWPWLEATRYADTDGYQGDPTRNAWPWRDHLVRMLNANQRFDRFTIEALAGDLLPDATPEQRLATGLLRNNAHNGEGGRIAEETRVENVFDRTETVGTVWLGLTLECARCHDHKYDPIPQRDYYRLYAFFDQTSESGSGRRGGVLAPAMNWTSEADRVRLAALDRQLAALAAALLADDPALDAAQQAWETEQAAALRAAQAEFVASELGGWQRSRDFAPPGDDPNRMFAEAYAPERLDEAGAQWHEAAELRDGEALQLPEGQYTTYFRRTIHSPTARRMQLSLGSDDAIRVWCDGEQVLANDVRRGVRADQESVTLRLQPGTHQLLVKIVNTGGLGGFYFRVVEETPGDLPAETVQALLAEARTDEQRNALRLAFRRANVTGHAEREAERDALRTERDALRQRGMQVSVMDHLPPERRRTTHVLGRGDYQSPGEAVTAGTPEFLPPLADHSPEHPPTRLDLARWLVSGQHPLVARVAVNRAWQTFFGRGLVATQEDFGRQGERPTHPDLLEWLAYEFVASGWNVKALHRRIVLSATYRQSAAAAPGSFADDPQNLLLARSPRFRLPAWMLRDQALALSGRLVEQLGGAPVRPYQPAGIWDEATFGVIRYQQDDGAALYRRSLYTFWRRIVGPTFFFDTPARLTCTVRRSETNTPLHALTTLNETGFVEAARGLAERSFGQASRTDDRIAWLFRAATCRSPEPAELAVLRARFEESRTLFANAPPRAGALLGVGAAAPATALPPDEFAALTVVASVVLNLDEVLTRP